MNKDYFKRDPYKPKAFDNKTYIFPEEENKDNINKLYTNFLTTGYDEILLEINKNNILNFKNDEGKTLIIAVLENSDLSELQKKQIIERLIHHKVSINAFDKYNRTSLHISCQLGYNSIIQLLIDKKVIKNELDNDGNAPVHYYIEHFIKDCNDYDAYIPNRNDIINPKEQKYSDIINNLFNIEIMNFLQNNTNYNKIKELIRLIKYFEINKINIEYDSFKKDIEFKFEEDLIDPDIKNKMFKNFIKFKNNVFKIFEDYNKISYVNEDDWDKLINQEKENIVETVKKNNQKINNEHFVLIKEHINEMKKSFNNITESLLLLIYFKNNFRFTVDTYKIDVAFNIAQRCQNIKTSVMNSLLHERVRNYSGVVINAISTDNSQADTHINQIFQFKADFDKNINDINIELEKAKGQKVNTLPQNIQKIKNDAEANANNTTATINSMINNIDRVVIQSIAETDEQIKNNVEDIKNSSNVLRSSIDYNIQQRTAIQTQLSNTNIYLPLQIAMQTAGAALLYDASHPLLIRRDPNIFISERNVIAIKSGAENSLTNAAEAIYEYIKAYKQSLFANYQGIQSIMSPEDKTTFKTLAAKKDILLDIFTPEPIGGTEDDTWTSGIDLDLTNLNRSNNLALPLANNTFSPVVITNFNNLQNQKIDKIIRIINEAYFQPVLPAPGGISQAKSNNKATITIYAVNSLIKRLLNRPSIRGTETIAQNAAIANVANIAPIMADVAYSVHGATIGAVIAEQDMLRLVPAYAPGNGIIAVCRFFNIAPIAGFAPGNPFIMNMQNVITAAAAIPLAQNEIAAIAAAAAIESVNPPITLEQAIFVGATVSASSMIIHAANPAAINPIVNAILNTIFTVIGGINRFNTAATPRTIAAAARQAATALFPALPATINEIAFITAATAASFPKTTDIMYQIQSEITTLRAAAPPRINIDVKTNTGLTNAKQRYNDAINNAITALADIKASIPLATCTVPPGPILFPYINVDDLNSFMQTPRFADIPAAPVLPAQLTIEDAIAVSKASKDAKDLLKMALDAYKDLAGINNPEIVDVINKANVLGAAIAEVNLNKAEILEIFAENLFYGSKTLNNANSEQIRNYSLNLLILSIFVNDRQIEEPINEQYIQNFSQVTASLNKFYSSSFKAFINSITSKINYILEIHKTGPAQPDTILIGRKPILDIFKKITDQITEMNKSTPTNTYVSGLETQINNLIAQASINIHRNIYNPNPANAVILPPPANIETAGGVSSEIQPWATSTVLIFGLIPSNFITIPFAAANNNKRSLRDYLFLSLNGSDNIIAERFSNIQPTYEQLLLGQRKKEAWDKTKEELLIIPPDVAKIQETQSSFDNITPDMFEYEYKMFKNNIFTSEDFNYTLYQLEVSTKTINNNSAIYYDCKSRKVIKTFIPDDDEACMYEYDKTKSCENEFRDSNIPDKYCADEYAKANFKCKYLFNNIKSEFLLKNGIFYLDSNYDTHVNFYDDENNELSFNYKFLNIHFIFELLDKYLYDIENINLPDNADEDYFDKINIETIFKIYSNYEKIICILNNLNVIYKKHLEINSKLDILKVIFTDLKDVKKNPYFNYRTILPDVVKVSVAAPAAAPAAKKKKYRIEQYGGFKNYVEEFTTRIDERITELDKKIDINKFNSIYDSFKSIMEKYNSIIENIDKKYSLQFLEFIKTPVPPPLTLQTQYVNRFMKLNDINFPDNIKLYFDNYFNKKGEIKKDEISKLFLILKDINYNEIYNNVAPQLDIKEYRAGYDYSLMDLHYVRNPYVSTEDKIYFNSQDIPDPNDDTKPFISEEDNAPDISNKDTFTLGFLNKDKDNSDNPAVLFRKLINELEKINIPAKENQRCIYIEQLLKVEPSYIRLTGMVNIIKNNEIDDIICLLDSCDSYMSNHNISALCKSCIKQFDKINSIIYFKDKTNVKNYFKKIDLEIDLNLFENLCFQRQISYIGQYIYHPNDFVNHDNLIILAVYYYNIYINYYINECKKNYLTNMESIYTSIRCKFEEEYSGNDRESKKIIKNFNRIIQNKEEAEKILEMKFNNLLKIFMEHQSNIETNNIIKLIFRDNKDLKDLVEKYSISPETIADKIKELNTKGRLYLIDPNKENDNRVSKRIINKVCLNESFLKKIKDFKFDLRFPDKNGNTVIHRLVDQLNEKGIQELLDDDSAIVTYKNNNNQTPLEYLLNIFNIITNSYKKDERQKKIDDIATKIHEDSHQDNVIRWTDKDTSVIYLNSLIQFNEFMWLNLYQFKNNINMTDITKLKEILKLKNKNKIKEDLLIRDIDEKIVKKKLDVIFGNNIKKRFENSIQKKINEERKVLQNTFDNLNNAALPKIFNQDEIDAEKAEITKKIIEIENKKKNVDDFIVIFKEQQQKSVEEIICYLDQFKKNFIKKTSINYEEFMEFAKLLDKDYLKLLHLLHDFKREETNYLFMCDFNYELITADIIELEKDKDKKDAYNKYFNKHIDTIIADFNDLDKYEDYSINYINQEILKIIYINMVFTISWEIYNTLLQYLFEKYNTESLEKTKNFDTKLVLKNLKLYLKNKIYEILDIKNPLKSYDSLELYKDLIINSFMDFANKKLEEEDKKKMEQIIEYYSKILQTIASAFYNDIKEYLIDQRKIIILLRIYNLLRNCEKTLKI